VLDEDREIEVPDKPADADAENASDAQQ